MAKLLLINPLFTGCVPIYPLSIVHAAAACRDIADVRCLDMNLLDEPFIKVGKELNDYKPDFVGIGLRNLETTDSFVSYLPPFWSLISLIKKVLPKCKVIAGGSGFSIMPKAIMESHKGIDFGNDGHAETIIPLLTGKSATDGIWVRDGEKIYEPANEEKQKKASFRWYPYELMEKLVPVEDYWRVNPEYGIGIQTKRGCARLCSYCVYPELEGQNLCGRTQSEVLADISFLYQKGVKRFFVSDSVANDSPEQFKQLCIEIKKMSLPVTWGGWFREDNMSEETASLAHEAGCDWFSFSPDGGCKAHLELLRKDLTMEQVKAAANACAKLPVRVLFHFFTNLPTESRQTIYETYENMKELHRIFIGRPGFQGVTCKNIRVYPGTHFYKIISEIGGDIPDNLLLPYFYNPGPYDKVQHIFEGICTMLLAQARQNNSNFTDIDNYFSSLIKNNTPESNK